MQRVRSSKTLQKSSSVHAQVRNQFNQEAGSPRKTADGFKVLNNGRSIPFPSHGWSREFDRLFREIAAPFEQ
jgi:hypothetical protein